MFAEDWSTGFYLLTGSAIEYMVLFTAQCVVVARRYHRAQQLEISFLKGQIHPHFIHNSLTGIAASVRTDPARARELLQDMSSYLRGFYDYDSDDLIPLKRELDLVRAYVSIEQMRFGDKIQVEYDIEADNILLPPLILQPLVENAFVHGLREKEDGGTILIYVSRVKKTKARIGVRDNGLGYGVRPSALGRHGVGIENINRRLSNLYRTQLVFTVPEGGGCEAHMEIPWKEAKADARVPC
jgi:LytS/YehU family sensor histidine kinase